MPLLIFMLNILQTPKLFHQIWENTQLVIASTNRQQTANWQLAEAVYLAIFIGKCLEHTGNTGRKKKLHHISCAVTIHNNFCINRETK